MDDNGLEIDPRKHLVPSYQWSTWEAIYAIKEVIEQTGWTGKKDTPDFIKKLERKRFKLSYARPEGDKYFRSEDHLSTKGLWIEQVKGERLVIFKRIPAEDTVYLLW